MYLINYYVKYPGTVENEDRIYIAKLLSGLKYSLAVANMTSM